MLLMVSLLPLSSCKPRNLTAERAEAALDQIPMGGGDAIVKHIGLAPLNRDHLTGPDTIAEVDLKNFKYNWHGASRTYSGPAKAGFDHYSDGRFILKRLCFRDPTSSPAAHKVIFEYEIRVP